MTRKAVWNTKAVWVVAVKDMRAIFANVQVWMPMVVIPVVLGVVLPAIAVGALRFSGAASMNNLDAVLHFLERLPPSPLRQALDAMPSLEQRLAYLMANYFFAPFFLLVPLMTSSVISADSFAGEKERGTLESLLLAPVDLTSLLVGKVLAALLPSVGLSLATFVLYGVAVNAVGWPMFGRVFFPQANWLPLMALVIPAISLVAVVLNVFISARVASFQAAYQMGGLVVLPVIGLLFGQVTGALLLDTAVMTVLGLVLAVLAWWLLRVIVVRLDRSRLFESQVR